MLACYWQRVLAAVVLTLGVAATGLAAPAVPAASVAPSAAPAVAATVEAPLATPAIPGEGGIHLLPDAAYQPPKNLVYKVVFAISRGSEQPGDTNSGLEAVARAMNLYVSAGVPRDHLNFVAVLYAGASGAALNAQHYKERYKVDNPNLDLIHKLRAAGVDIAVCGQAILGQKYSLDWVNPDVKVALSGLTTITSLQATGYALMPL